MTCEKLLKQAIIFTKAQDNHSFTEYHAKGLVDMAVETFMAVLLLEKSKISDRYFNIAKRFVSDTYHRVQTNAEKIINSNENPVDACKCLLDSSYTIAS
jgi:alanyl-tRNA synthetase